MSMNRKFWNHNRKHPETLAYFIQACRELQAMGHRQSDIMGVSSYDHFVLDWAAVA